MPPSFFPFFFGALYSDLQFSQGTLQATDENCLEGFAVCMQLYFSLRNKKAHFETIKVSSPFPSTKNKQFCLLSLKDQKLQG